MNYRPNYISNWKSSFLPSTGTATEVSDTEPDLTLYDVLSPDGNDRLIRATDDASTTVLVAPNSIRYDVNPV